MPAATPQLWPTEARKRHRLRNSLLIASLGLVVLVCLGAVSSVYLARKAKAKIQAIVQSEPSPSAQVEKIVADVARQDASSQSLAAEGSDAGSAASFPAWHSSSASAANLAPPRAGMLVVTAIGDPEGDYESMKQIRSVDAEGITLTYHGAKPKDGHQEVADVTRLVLTKDLNSAHDYAEMFALNQPLSFPGTTAITASKEVFLELSEKGSSEFTFQPDGLKGSLGNMVNVLSAFGGLSGKELDKDPALKNLSKDACTLKRQGPGLVAFPVLLDDQPSTLPALHASCSTDDGPAEFYILNQPDYPLMLAWKLGSGSQLEVTKISYGPPQAKAETAAASTHIEQQLQENKKAEVYGIYFDFGSDHLKPESKPVLNEIGAVLTAHPDWKLTVNGHTDNIGGDDYNLDLSKRRSASVKAELVEKYNIASARLGTEGFGSSQPVDTNGTLAGRARNRRVELVRE